MDKKIKMTKENLKFYKQELIELEKKINKLNREKGKMFGIDYQENIEVDDINSEILSLQMQRDNLKKLIMNSIIIEKTLDETQVDINDIVRITSGNDNTNPVEFKVKLNGSKSGVIDGIMNISLNSPIGKAIYGKRVGEQYFTQNGESQNIKGTILDIQKDNVKLEQKVNTKVKK